MGLSIVCTSYNRAEYLPAALDSAIAVKEVAEIVVVDDYSADPAVAEIIKAKAGTDTRVKPIFRSANGGESAALNTGIRATTQDWVMVLHDDDLMHPTAGIVLMKKAEAAGLEMVWGDAVDLDASGNVTKMVMSGPPDRDRIWREDYIYLTAMVWRKSIHDRIGWFDEELRSNLDWDFEIRFINECRCGYFPGVVARYRRHNSNKSKLNAGNYMKECEAKFRIRLKPRYGYK